MAQAAPAVPSADSVFPQNKEQFSHLYIIGLRKPALASPKAVSISGRGLPRTSRGRLDVQSSEARTYVDTLRAEQDQFLNAATQLLGRPVTPIAPQFRFQHAFNGMVLSLSDQEVQALGTLPDVAMIEPYAEYPLDTDAGPALLDAAAIWSGSGVPTGVGTRGEGVVVGIIDSGINFDSPSFAATEPGHPGIPGGYTHINPFGPGNYVGTCAPGGVDAGLCNDKLIGAYDFVFSVQCPGGVCGAGTTDEPSVEDSNGHGSHTASTTAGNAVVAPFSGITVNLSGVARHANVIAYDACYTRISDNGGLCPNVSTLNSINQAVADGIVDVLNYSIGGGASPWGEAGSQAFLNATNAGIYVAASAGNSGPGPGTLGHVEPWVGTTGASTHNRVFGYDFDLTGPTVPTAPPANTQDLLVRPGGAPIATTSLVNAPLIISPNFGNPPNDGCAAYPANFFRRPATAGGTQGLAVIRLPPVGSNCASGARRTAALNAGAVGVLFVVDGPTNLGATGTTWQMDVTPNWTNVLAHVNTDPATATATINAPIAGLLIQQPDVMAGFSSRGPSGFDVLKPDLTAPGVNIIAVINGASTQYALNSGTSMASPHHAGSAALLRALYPSWSTSEIKSALMGVARTANVFKENGTTPSDPLDRGAGRIDLARAATVGLVLDETGADYLNANPATGGDPSTLNLPSLANDNCVGTCTFTRTLKGVRAGSITYNLAITGFPGASATISPASITVGPNGTANITVTIDSLQLTQNVWTFGEVTATPTVAHIPTTRLPVAIRASLPDVELSPTSHILTVPSNTVVTRPLTVRNVGNPTLNWSRDEAGQATVRMLQQDNNAANGFSVNFYSGQAPTPGGAYGAEDVTPLLPVTLRRIAVQGFMTGTPATNLNALATAITFKVYSDAGGVPAGNPEAGAGGELYSCVRTPVGPNSAGLTFNSADGAFYSLDIAAATGCPAGPALAAGTPYWVAAFPTVPGNSGARRWVWFRGVAQAGAPSVIISPLGIAGNPTAWGAIPAVSSYATTLDGDVQCGAPWLSVSPTGASLGLAQQSDVTLTIDTTGLAPGNYFGSACVDTGGTDPDEPKLPVPVVLSVSDNPTGVGAANPATVDRGADTLLTVVVTSGTNPASTGVTVTADLTSIGGGAADAFNDAGTGGDVTAADGTYSRTATVSTTATPGAKTLPFTVADAQLRSSTGDITLTVNAATDPSGVGLATPNSVTVTGQTLLTVQVTGGTSPPSTGVAVTADLSAIGGSATQALNDTGANGDVTAADGTFSYNATVAANTTPGALSLPATITDAESRTASTSIALTVNAGGALAGSGVATPASVAQGASTRLEVDVTPATDPASTGITVTVDLSAYGGSAAQVMYDDGTNGDVAGGDGTYTVLLAIPGDETPGAASVTATVNDAQSRTATANIAFTVTGPSGDALFTDGFESP